MRSKHKRKAFYTSSIFFLSHRPKTLEQLLNRFLKVVVQVCCALHFVCRSLWPSHTSSRHHQPTSQVLTGAYTSSQAQLRRSQDSQTKSGRRKPPILLALDATRPSLRGPVQQFTILTGRRSGCQHRVDPQGPQSRHPYGRSER